MKYSVLLLISFFSFLSQAQTHQKAIEEIRTHFKWINSQKNLSTVSLENGDYLEFPPDNGASLTGYYIDKTLYKVVEKIGLSYGIITTEYYLWNNDLFFVYYNESDFGVQLDDSGGFQDFDNDIIETKYEESHYFQDASEIKTLVKEEKSGPDRTESFTYILMQNMGRFFMDKDMDRTII